MRNIAPLLLVLLAGCDAPALLDTKDSALPTSADSQDAIHPPESSPLILTNSGKPSDGPASPGPNLAPPSPAEASSLAKSTNAFAFDLFQKTRETKGNFAMSPASIAMALTMTWGGAKGETAQQMKKVLHLDGTVDQAMEASGKLIASYKDPKQPFTLRIANRLFGEKSYAFERPYLDKTESAYGAPLDKVDFKGNPEVARVDVNDWIAKQTNNRIKDLLPSGSVNPDTRLILANAIYFLADWATPFKKEATSPAAFQPVGAPSHDVSTMHAVDYAPFVQLDGVKVVELPYQGNDIAMDFVLPDQVDGLESVEKNLDSASLAQWVSGLKPTSVSISLPKFTIDPQEPMSLGADLEAMGMPLAFDPKKADFGAIANPSNADDRLFISSVVHKAFVKLDEKGTEAAAATAILMATAGAEAPVEKPVEFRADHPFLFVLRDVHSGLILFMGRVADPTA